MDHGAEFWLELAQEKRSQYTYLHGCCISQEESVWAETIADASSFWRCVFSVFAVAWLCLLHACRDPAFCMVCHAIRYVGNWFLALCWPKQETQESVNQWPLRAWWAHAFYVGFFWHCLLGTAWPRCTHSGRLATSCRATKEWYGVVNSSYRSNHVEWCPINDGQNG